MGTVRIVCISDTHGHRPDLPEGDLLIHAGDLCTRGTPGELRESAEWIDSLHFDRIIIVPGNHDVPFQEDFPRSRACFGKRVTVLVDEPCLYRGLKVYGSPWQPFFLDWAFNLRERRELAEKWAGIPDDTEILVTHSPPYGILDEGRPGERLGCDELAKRVSRLPSLKLHVFGHIHQAYGIVINDSRVSMNASICDGAYHPVNEPLVFEAASD